MSDENGLQGHVHIGPPRNLVEPDGPPRNTDRMALRHPNRSLPDFAFSRLTSLFAQYRTFRRLRNSWCWMDGI